jgi:hypothetical protein
METILIENNNLVIASYGIPIFIFFMIISFLYVNINYIKEKIKK